MISGVETNSANVGDVTYDDDWRLDFRGIVFLVVMWIVFTVLAAVGAIASLVGRTLVYLSALALFVWKGVTLASKAGPSSKQDVLIMIFVIIFLATSAYWLAGKIQEDEAGPS